MIRAKCKLCGEYLFAKTVAAMRPKLDTHLAGHQLTKEDRRLRKGLPPAKEGTPML